jgi:hypothetical protein
MNVDGASNGNTFNIEEEDHTLANSLRFFLNKKCGTLEQLLGVRMSAVRACLAWQAAPSMHADLAVAFAEVVAERPSHASPCTCSPTVAFSSYSMPHPSEELVTLRVQTLGEAS